MRTAKDHVRFKRSWGKKNHNSLIWLAVPRGVEPPTFGLGIRVQMY